MPKSASEAIAGLFLWLMLGLAALAYSGGLGGHFIFDDSWNLRGLERIDREQTVESVRSYIVDGIASDVGRPLAMASFILHYASWPYHPRDFLVFNVGLHLLNACLLCWAMVRLFRLTPDPPAPAPVIAVALAALWVIAPLQASAVLYIVQRMALLAGTFVFLGLLLYLIGREQLARGQDWRGAAIMAFGTGVGTGLGVLAKESAVLLPLLLLVIEFTLGQRWPRGRVWSLCCAALLALPTLVVLGYMAAHLGEWQVESLRRGYALDERLLSEARVLFLYLQKLLLPSLYSIRLLYDDYPVSRSLIEPWTTLPSVLGWLALTILAFALRRRAPVFAFAVLWFLAAHLLESTIVPLELAFEHRNYVAAVGPLAALFWYGARLARAPQLPRLAYALPVAAALYAGFQWTALWQSARLWGDPFLLAMYWSEAQPGSRRAHFLKADTFLAYQMPDEALGVYEKAMPRWPGDPSLPIAVMEIVCYFPDVGTPPVEAALAALRRFDAQEHQTLNMMDRIIKSVENGKCVQYDLDAIERVSGAIAATEAFAPHRRNVVLMQSRVAELKGDRGAAMHYLDEALAVAPTMRLLIQAVIWSVENGEFKRAWGYVKMAEEHRGLSPIDHWAYRDTVEELRTFVSHYENESQSAQPD